MGSNFSQRIGRNKMEVTVSTEVSITAKKLIGSMSMEEIGEFLSEAAEIFNTEFKQRNAAASSFADGLSENGCRFLAEAVTHHYMRQPVK